VESATIPARLRLRARHLLDPQKCPVAIDANALNRDDSPPCDEAPAGFDRHRVRARHELYVINYLGSHEEIRRFALLGAIHKGQAERWKAFARSCSCCISVAPVGRLAHARFRASGAVFCRRSRQEATTLLNSGWLP
jgi:hypothetical protein